MSNRIKELMDSGREDLLTIYFTAGFPSLGDTRSILELPDQVAVVRIERIDTHEPGILVRSNADQLSEAHRGQITLMGLCPGRFARVTMAPKDVSPRSQI